MSETLRLPAWLSPAFPTGAFAYSHGVEWAVESGDIKDRDSLLDWLETLLRLGSARTDAILLRNAHRAATDLEALATLTELALATAPAAERRAEAIHQGNAFIAAAASWNPATLTTLAAKIGDIPYPIAVGAMTGTNDISEDTAAAALLHAFAASLISAAIRIIPLGQSTGLSVLVALEPTILAVTTATKTATLDDLGATTWRRPRRHAPRDRVHKAVPLMMKSTNGPPRFNGPLRIGIGGPVGTGKTALMDALCKRLSPTYDIAAITNDIYTKEDAEFLTRAGSLPPDRILGIETGGDNLAATFSPELADLTIYVIDVSAGDQVPRKGGPGITRSDLLVINKIDLAPHVGASLEVMDRDSKRMRGDRPYLFTNIRAGQGVAEIARFIEQAGGLSA